MHNRPAYTVDRHLRCLARWLTLRAALERSLYAGTLTPWEACVGGRLCAYWFRESVKARHGA